MRIWVLRIGRSAGSSALALAALLSGCGPGPPSVENVVLVSLDTTRRDHLSVYGYPRATTPRLAGIADRCAVFEAASAQATITKPSHASIFTGLYPHTHELGGNTSPLADRFVTLTEVLAARGLRTGAFVGGYPLKKKVAGLLQGFETYDSRFREMRRDGQETVDRALDWIRGIPPEEPYFLFLHFYDAHGPYTAGESDAFSPQTGPVLDFIPEYQQLSGPQGEPLRHLGAYVDRYDALVRKQDELLGRVLDAIDLDETLLVVTADHGETLGDRESVLNLDHGTSLFEEQIAIPLLFCGPGVVAGRYPQVVESVDIMPTVLDLIEGDLSTQFEFQGQSLAPLLQGRGESDLDGTSFASNQSKPKIHLQRGYELDTERFIHSVRKENWKLIRYPGIGADYVELYDLASDPGERSDVASDHPDVASALGQLLDEWLVAEPETGPWSDLSDEERRQLEALGYVGD